MTDLEQKATVIETIIRAKVTATNDAILTDLRASIPNDQAYIVDCKAAFNFMTKVLKAYDDAMSADIDAHSDLTAMYEYGSFGKKNQAFELLYRADLKREDIDYDQFEDMYMNVHILKEFRKSSVELDPLFYHEICLRLYRGKSADQIINEFTSELGLDD